MLKKVAPIVIQRTFYIKRFKAGINWYPYRIFLFSNNTIIIQENIKNKKYKTLLNIPINDYHIRTFPNNKDIYGIIFITNDNKFLYVGNLVYIFTPDNINNINYNIGKNGRGYCRIDKNIIYYVDEIVKEYEEGNITDIYIDCYYNKKLLKQQIKIIHEYPITEDDDLFIE